MISKLLGIVDSDCSCWKDFFCPKSSILEWRRVLWTRMWPSLLRKLLLGPLFALPSLSFSLEVLATWECGVGACSWRSHEQASSAKSKFQALWLPRVVRNVVCGFWIFTINWKEFCLETAGPMTPGRSGSYLHAWDVSCQVLCPALFLRMLSNRKPYLCLFLSGLQTGTLTRCPLFMWLPVHYASSLIFGFCILLLSLSLCCKWCRKQMLDKIPKAIERFSFFFFSFQWYS